MRLLFRYLIICLFIMVIDLKISLGYLEQGIWNFDLKGSTDHEQTVVVTKSMLRSGSILTGIECKLMEELPDSNTLNVNVTWYLRKASCWKEYYESTAIDTSPMLLFRQLETPTASTPIIYATDSELVKCDGTMIYLKTSLKKFMTLSDSSADAKQKSSKSNAESEANNVVTPIAITKRDLKDGSTVPNSSSLPNKSGSAQKQPLYVVPGDGIYQFFVGIKVQHELEFPVAISNDSFDANLHIEMYSDYGYLSAADYPLLIFYSTMCVVYVIYGVCWLIVSFMRWRELLRVQYWIGAVILLGMLEKAVFTAEYESVNNKGTSVRGLIVFAELVSCAKRTLSRMLVIIVSFGFGIVKPRLGIVLHRVVGVGFVYFLLASIEGCMRALRPKIPNDEYSRRLLFAIIPLALLESAICWWVFSALVSTTRTLRLRRNTIKLDLFKHFTNTLVFAVATSVIFMLWSIKYRNFDECLSDWKQLWVNDAFWHVLFAIILLVIMILWRPTNNNQRFAFSPLLDEGSEADEEEEEKLMAHATETMKYRNSRNSNSSSPKVSQSVEDDLKWVEEHIPSSFANTGLPMLDSDEEILTTKFEISKMQ